MESQDYYRSAVEVWESDLIQSRSMYRWQISADNCRVVLGDLCVKAHPKYMFALVSVGDDVICAVHARGFASLLFDKGIFFPLKNGDAWQEQY